MLRSSDMATPKRRTPIVAVARCMIVAKTIMAIVGLRRMRRGETRPPVLQQWEILPQVSYDELRRLEVMDCHRRGQQYAQSEKRRLTWIGMCPDVMHTTSRSLLYTDGCDGNAAVLP